MSGKLIDLLMISYKIKKLLIRLNKDKDFYCLLTFLTIVDTNLQSDNTILWVEIDTYELDVKHKLHIGSTI